MASEALPELHGRVTMVSGGFDPLHDGHIAYFEAAAELGRPVFCNVTGDAYIRLKHPPLLAQGKRTRVIDAIRHIAYTHVSDLSTREVLERARPRYFVKGSDWEGRLPADELAACEEAGTEIVYLDTVISSSSDILARCLKSHREEARR